MDLFVQDTKLNISAAYLRPGFAFGGSCLPKDLRALLANAKDQDIELPLLQSVLASNVQHITEALKLIEDLGHRKVGILGLAFKEGTDDLRESPMVTVAEKLIERGFELSIYDRYVKLSELRGTNKHFVESRLPNLQRLLTGDLDSVLKNSELLVVGSCDHQFQRLPELMCDGQVVLDLVRLYPGTHGNGLAYQSIV